MSGEYNMIEDLFKKYKSMTEDMIDKFNNNINIDGMLADRKKILEEINEISLSGSEKKKIYMSLGIDKIDEKLGKLIKDSLDNIKEEIRLNKLRKQTNNSYNKVMNNYSFFTKRA